MKEIDYCSYCPGNPERCGRSIDKCNYISSVISFLRNSRLPRNKWERDKLYSQDCDINSFKKLADIERHIEEYTEIGDNNNILICGKHTGNGKTSWAIKLMQAHIANVAGYHYMHEYEASVFVPTNQFIHDAKQFGKPPYERYLEVSEAADIAELTVWDDIGAADYTKYDYTTLFVAIDRRVFAGKCNVFTTNITDRDEFAQKVGERLADRIWMTSEIIELNGESQRGL